MGSVIGILDCAEENQRLELWLETDQTPHLVLRLAAYADGLGWQVQKSIPIDQTQAQQMQFLLAGANRLLNQSPQSITNSPKTSRSVAEFSLAARKSA